jgi:hypothetical protein
VKCNTPVPFTSVLPLHRCILFSVACLAAKRAPFASLLIVAEYGSCIVPGALSFSASSASVHSSSIPTRVVGASSLGLIQRGSKYAISRCSSLGGSSRDLSRGFSRDFERGSNTSRATEATFLGSVTSPTAYQSSARLEHQASLNEGMAVPCSFAASLLLSSYESTPATKHRVAYWRSTSSLAPLMVEALWLNRTIQSGC